MSVLVCGSLAYDTVMVFDDKFKLQAGSTDPANPSQAVEVYYIVPDLRRGFGGCAGNIVYNLTLLGRNAYPMGTTGTDFGAYAAWLEDHGISGRYIKQMEHVYTAQSFTTLDVDDNRIVAFHPGAMNFSHTNPVPADPAIHLGVMAPDAHEGILTHLHQFNELSVPCLFYPGNAMPQLSAEELLGCIQMAEWVVVNTREAARLQQATGLSAEQLGQRVKAYIVNHGLQGASIHTHEAHYQIPAPEGVSVSDPSGCDDAFCAGLVYGLLGDIDWETAGRIATLMWSIAAQHHGTQTYSISLDKFKSQFKKIFGYALIA